MTKSLALVAVVLLFTFVAAAQEVPRMETFLGYTYVRANSASNVPAFSANGGGGQFVYNFNKWIGAVADIGAVHNGNISGVHIDDTTTNFLFGPRVAIRKWNRVTPYFQVLWGGVYGAFSNRIELVYPTVLPTQIVYLPGLNTFGVFPIPGEPFTARLTTSQTAFAMTAGGGLDIKINKHMSFRPIGLDYYLTRFQNLRTQGDNNQNNLRYTTGINFTLGAQ